MIQILAAPISLIHCLIIWAISNRVLSHTLCFTTTIGIDIVFITARALLGSYSLYWHGTYQQYYATLSLVFALTNNRAYCISYMYLLRYADLYNILKNLEREVFSSRGWTNMVKIVKIFKITTLQVIFFKLVGLLLRYFNPKLIYPNGQLHIYAYQTINMQISRIMPQQFMKLVKQAPQQEVFVVWIILFALTASLIGLWWKIEESFFKKKQIKLNVQLKDKKKI